ncbi:hypothetical protein ELE36_08655 [Pseudolysobacter antarcticus]|uniref:Uncharacterized protein n=1 Tax=Pseudolysobacter antarcticus TaxID=2511995 RepID=A0A411HIS3_9GAMM|nr:hypothetical protein [Pseudolysobacter antarcticus]QBB70432.1 hypothetical protein ELE36_08655 [Pseudolysobacter antarcticus]
MTFHPTGPELVLLLLGQAHLRLGSSSWGGRNRNHDLVVALRASKSQSIAVAPDYSTRPLPGVANPAASRGALIQTLGCTEMFSRLVRWLEQNRQSRQANDAAWSPLMVRGADKLTSFQHQAAQQLCISIGQVALERLGKSEIYLSGTLPSTQAIVFIYAEGAQIHIDSKAVFLAERHDYAQPQELIQRFVTAAKQCAN